MILHGEFTEDVVKEILKTLIDVRVLPFVDMEMYRSEIGDIVEEIEYLANKIEQTAITLQGNDDEEEADFEDTNPRHPDDKEGWSC